MATQNGVIYYKLDPRYHYQGDSTKNCGLSGGEIDGNFNFLRGYDIAGFEVSEDKTQLTIIRHNGEKLPVNIYNPNLYHFEYDKVNGVLKVSMVSGEGGKPIVVDEVEGFLSEKNFHVYGNATITGDGTRYRPIQVSSIARTGTYQPVFDLVDAEDIPMSGNTKGDRYITKEKVSSFGLLYPLDGVAAIQKRLEEIGSEWRVPTKADWDQLLNIVEDCPQDKTHDDKTNPANVYLGVNAGAYLKSNSLWEPIYRKIQKNEDFIEGERFNLDENGNFIPDENGGYVKELYSEDRFGFSIYPLGFGERRGISTIGGFGKWAAFWTTSEEDTKGDMFVKVFSNDERGVEQNTWGRDCYLSVRLVKDYNGSNLNDVEDIDGKSVSTIYIDVKDVDREKYNTTLIWTRENVCFTNKEYGGVVSKEWENEIGKYTKEKFYINDWDGTKWVKYELREGESVVMLEHNGVKMHEWRLVDGEFIDTVEMIKGEFSKQLTEIDNAIRTLAGRLDEVDAVISQEISDRKAADDVLSGRIDDLADRMDAAETGITANAGAIDALEGRMDAAETGITANAGAIDALEGRMDAAESGITANAGAIDALADRMDAAETGITANAGAIDALAERMDAAETDITANAGAIDALTDRMDAAETGITANTKAIEDEVSARTEAVKAVADHLDVVETEYKAADDVLSGRIDANKIYPTDNTLIVGEPSDVGTGISVKIPEMGMIKSDADGLYFDGDYSFGGNIIKNITE